MTVYAIGDVQGCYDELIELLDQLAFDPARDRLWFTGDLVNRGPRSLDVLRYVRGLGPRAITVLGNHDIHLLAVALSAGRLRPSDTLDEVLHAPDRDVLLDWLRRLPLLHHDPALGFTLVHAGFAPQWDLVQAQDCAREVEAALGGPAPADFLAHLYGDQPAYWTPDIEGWERLRFSVNCLTRLRYCDAAGRLVLGEKGAPGRQAEGLMPWFAVPGRRSDALNIVFGHWSTLGGPAAQRPGVYPLDTGCVWGGRLTAVRLPDLVHYSVPCRGACAPGEE